MPTPTNRERALTHAANVNALADELRAEYAGSRRTSRIADLHARIGRHLKLGTLHAQLAQADAVDDLRAELVELLRRRPAELLDGDELVRELEGLRP